MEPPLSPFDIYIQHFFELDTCRGERGPISFLTMHQYAQVKNIDDFEEFSYIMRKLDDVYLGHQSKERKKKEKDGGANANKKNPGKG